MPPPAAYCATEGKACVGWVDKYFKDCLCNVRDDFSFGFGLISLVCWGIAEIPQIITNFRTKSSHGVSLVFLLTWVAGDIFNLVGCLLEPSTLPTQFYTALLYTISTIVLVLQSVYYDHIHRWWKFGGHKVQGEEEKTPSRPKSAHENGIPIPKGVSPKAATRRDFYYTSARSLAGSGTSRFRTTYLRAAKSGPSALELNGDQSSSDDEAASVPSKRPMTQPRPIPRSVGYGTFLAGSLNLPKQSKALTETYMRFRGRKLLQEHRSTNVCGQWLGWLMAAIYMGGRLPQIWLNIKRGSVEGLDPLMFIFALVANVTYVLSIVVRTTKWENIKDNMPWLLDAVVCVALDFFIIMQNVYYKYLGKSATDSGHHYEAYGEASKAPLLS